MKCITAALKLLFAAIVLMGCRERTKNTISYIILKNSSAAAPMVSALPGQENIRVYSLITGSDTLSATPDFIYGRKPSASSLIKDPRSKGYVLYTAHQQMGSVSRILLDSSLTPVKGEYIVDQKVVTESPFSVSLATPEEHGFPVPVLIVSGSSLQVVNPFGLAADRHRTDRAIGPVSKGDLISAGPLLKNTYPGKTVMVMGENIPETRHGIPSGSLLLYASDTHGNLHSGQLYGLEYSGINEDTFFKNVHQPVQVRFVKIPSLQDDKYGSRRTGHNGKNIIRFARITHLDYGKTDRPELFFTAYNSADGKRKGHWFIYKLVLGKDDFTKGSLEMILGSRKDSSINFMDISGFHVSENNLYLLEKPGVTERSIVRPACIWQYDFSSKRYKPLIVLNDSSLLSRGACWELGGLTDISEVVHLPATFLLSIRPYRLSDSQSGMSFLANDPMALSGGQSVVISGMGY